MCARRQADGALGVGRPARVRRRVTSASAWAGQGWPIRPAWVGPHAQVCVHPYPSSSRARNTRAVPVVGASFQVYG
jgi:hypothetical protein